MPWSEWITRDPETVTQTAVRRWSEQFWGLKDAYDEPTGTYPAEAETDPAAYDCSWHWMRLGHRTPASPFGILQPDPWNGTCPTDITGDEYWPSYLYSDAITASYSTGLPGNDFSLLTNTGMAILVAPIPFASNHYSGDWGDDWLDVEYEEEETAIPAIIDLKIDVTATEDPDHPATEAMSYVITYPAWADPDTDVGTPGDVDYQGKRVSGQTTYGINNSAGPVGGEEAALYAGSEGPESLGEWDSITVGTQTVTLDYATVHGQVDASSGFPYAGNGGVVVAAALSALLGDSAPDFEPKAYVQNGTLYGLKVAATMKLQIQKCRYRYFTEDVIPPDPPGEPISTSITGSNGSARRSFYNARRRR